MEYDFPYQVHSKSFPFLRAYLGKIYYNAGGLASEGNCLNTENQLTIPDAVFSSFYNTGVQAINTIISGFHTGSLLSSTQVAKISKTSIIVPPCELEQGDYYVALRRDSINPTRLAVTATSGRPTILTLGGDMYTGALRPSE